MSGARATRPSPARYFEQLNEAWASAAGRCGEVSFELSIGPWPMRVSFASRQLADGLLPPLRRLLVRGSEPPLTTIRAWDSASTATALPPIPWQAIDVRAHGVVRGFNDARFRTLYREDQLGFRAVSMFDAHEQVGLFWFAHHERIHWYERAEPLRAGIHWALGTDRRYLAHASAVGDARGAVLLTGKGGAGKTTTTLASLAEGLHFVGDNYVLLSLDPEPTVYGLYGNAKLWPQTLDQLPHLRPLVDTFDIASDEKLVVDVARYRPERIATGLRVRAVVVPEVTGARKARITRCSRVEALLALAPTTVLQLPHVNGGLTAMGELVRKVPTYKLALGEDVTSGPRALSALLDELSS